MTAEPDGSERRGLARRIVAFAGLPFLSLLIPFLFLPILARLAGADAWLAIAVGQSVGGFAALVVALGYNTVGPTLVAVEADADRPEVLRRSLAPRAVLFVPAVVVACVVAAIIAPGSQRLEAVLMAVALTLAGLSSTWYMVGLGRAGLIVVYDLVPRFVATLLAAGLLVAFGSVLWYPVLLILAALIASVAFVARTVGARRALAVRRGELGATIREHRSAMAIEVAGGAYNALAVTLVTVGTTVAQAATYVSGDKLYRIGQYSVSALGNALQGWAVEAGPDRFRRRARTSILAHLALGLLGFAAFALLGPWLSGLLFGDVVRIDEPTALGLGVATIGIALGTAFGRVILVGLGARREFLTSVLAGATVGVPAILLLSSLWGAAGGAWGLALGETASVLCQAVFVVRRWPRRESVAES